MTKMTGSCNCGEIRYEVPADSIKSVVNCHCRLCRKMNGAAFSTYVVVLKSEFMLLSGSLKDCRVTAKSTKHICEQCGTPIFNENPAHEGLTILHLGSIDASPQLVPQVNIYCSSQVDWLEQVTRLPGFEQGIA